MPSDANKRARRHALNAYLFMPLKTKPYAETNNKEMESPERRNEVPVPNIPSGDGIEPHAVPYVLITIHISRLSGTGVRHAKDSASNLDIQCARGVIE